MGTTVIDDFGAVFTRWRVWGLLSRQDILLRYRRSVLGPFWISISMAVLVVGIALLYGRIFEQPFRAFLFYLAAGLVVWNLILSLVTETTSMLSESEAHLRAVPTPVPVIAARMIKRNIVIFGHNVLVVGGLVALFGLPITPAVLMAVPGLALIIALGFFFSIVVAPMCLRFRDLAQVVTNAMQLVFFMTPILWMRDQGRVDPIFVNANPFYHLVELVRAPIQGNPPTGINWIVAGSLAAVFAVLAVASLHYSRRKIYLWL